jgi:hypothetical protein
MAKRSNPIKERLLRFLEVTKLTNREFYRKTGFPNGFINKVENFGSDKLERIRQSFPHLNILWLLSGEGDMFLNDGNSTLHPASVVNPPAEWQIDDKLHEIDALNISDAEKLKLYRRIIDSKNIIIRKYIEETKLLLQLLERYGKPPATG